MVVSRRVCVCVCVCEGWYSSECVTTLLSSLRAEREKERERVEVAR